MKGKFFTLLATAAMIAGGTIINEAYSQQRGQQGRRGGNTNIREAMPDVGVVDNTLDSLNLIKTIRPPSGSSRVGNNPVLFLVGNSTMRTGTRGNGDNGQWGWGYYEGDFFDETKITVENHALGGTSSRSFYNTFWPDVLKGMKSGDWVFIELGHNDGGSFNSGRSRASMRGSSTDTMVVTIEGTGKTEIVYTFGGYMRKYINEARAKGAKPVLVSPTPRNSWNGEGKINRMTETYTQWCKDIAREMNVPFIDLNDITASTYESWGKFGLQYAKNRVNTMFYGDGIHTSAFGAKVNAESAVKGIRENKDLAELAQYLKPEKIDAAGQKREAGKPVIFVTGDSTAKNNDRDEDGMWGWGSVLYQFVDPSKAIVDNQAMAGRSARTFLDEGRWDRVYNAIQPGDVVFIQFGHNDGAAINTGVARGELRGNSDSSSVFLMARTRRNQVVYTYGWYIRKFANDVLSKGGIPVVLSSTPRNDWTPDGKMRRVMGNYKEWAKEAADAAGALFIDLNEISYQKLSRMGNKEKVDPYFKNDHTHTSLKGAQLNAQSVAEGTKALSDNRIKGLFK